MYVYIMARFRKITLKYKLARSCYVEIKAFSSSALIVNTSKITHKSIHSIKLCRVAYGVHIAYVLGNCGLERISKHISGHMTYGTFYI